MDITQVAKTMNVKDFKSRFTQENQGLKDNHTGKIHFCIHDLGFKITQKDCLEIRDSKLCVNEAIEYLEFRNEQRKNKKEIEINE